VRPCFEHGSISLQKRGDPILLVSSDDATYLELDTLLADILVWAVHNPAPSNLMVISKIISHETELLHLLHDSESKGYSIFIAHADEATPPRLPPGSLEWHLDELLAGSKPISLAVNYSRDKINMIQNDISGYHHTGIFWNMDDCPVPGGLLDYCFMKTLSTGFKSVMVYGKRRNSVLYADLLRNTSFPVTLVERGDKDARIKKMFKDIFLWALDRPQTSRSTVVVITESFPDNMYDALSALSSRNCKLVLVDPHAVSYVNSVWLLPSLFGGDNPIDLRGRKKASK
ncbi:unnamed protein product, partial [Brassica oleracea]|uniref:NYN domain-containing protein n=3 Tax=Brassica oleracea TaxID=3712 RepID=A0A0D2ZRC4_BRAOL